MRMPTFLILGAARSGTTSLHYYLDQHPDICMSMTKEPNYFAFEPRGGEGGEMVPMFAPDPRMTAKSVTDLDRYQRLFKHCGSAAACGEASPLYLYTEGSPLRIASVLPDARTIAVLRHPVERAYSHFLHVFRGHPNEANAAFRASVERELAIGTHYTPYKTGTHYLRMSRYHDQVLRYREAMDPEQLLLVRFDDLNERPAKTLRQICGHLGVDPAYPFDVETVYNRSGVVSTSSLRFVRAALTRVQPWVKSVLPASVSRRIGKARAKSAQPAGRSELPDDLRHQLLEYFADDVDRMEELTGWDLTHWRR